MSQAASFEELASKLDSASASEQERVLLAVQAGRSQGEKAEQVLWKLISDPSEEVRRYAVNSLTNIASQTNSFIRKLWEIFREDPDEDVRSMAVSSLGSALRASRDRETFTQLKHALADEKDLRMKKSIFDAMMNIVGAPKQELAGVKSILGGFPSFKVDWRKIEELEATLTERREREPPLSSTDGSK